MPDTQTYTAAPPDGALGRRKELSRKTALIAGGVVLAACIALIACAFVLRPAPATEQEAAQEQEAVPTEEGSPEAGEPEEAGAALSEEQQRLIDAYSEKEREIAALLASSTWTASKETASVIFTEDAFTEVKNGEEASAGKRSFAICALDEVSSVEGGVNGEHVQTDDATISILLDDGSYAVMHLITQTSTSSELPAITVSCTAFKDAASYLRVRAANGMSVEGLNDEVKGLLDGKQDELASVLTEWCAIYYPTAFTASWDGKVTLNYNSNALETSFSLNNQASTRITVTYDMAYGDLAIKAGA